MARATSPADSEQSDVQMSKTEKAVKDTEVEEDDDDEEGPEPEEYEIEKILDAKRGVFAGGRIGYLVKWKGYPASENSYVDEADIGGAQDLVDEFWRTHPKKSTLLSSVKKKARQSTTDSVSAAGTKRGRKSTAKTELESEDEDGAPSAARASKKAKRGANNGKSASIAGRTASPEIDANPQTMPENYMHLSDWDDIVRSVDTVERDADTDALYVYFTLHDGTQVKETTSKAKKKLPQKLLDFYESNLRWRTAEE